YVGRLRHFRLGLANLVHAQINPAAVGDVYRVAVIVGSCLRIPDPLIAANGQCDVGRFVEDAGVGDRLHVLLPLDSTLKYLLPFLSCGVSMYQPSSRRRPLQLVSW